MHLANNKTVRFVKVKVNITILLGKLVNLSLGKIIKIALK